MKRIDMKDSVLFVESAFYMENVQTEKDQAKEYLRLWKENLLQKLRLDRCNWILLDEMLMEHPAYIYSPISLYASITIKLYFKKKLPYEVHEDGICQYGI